jgi:hypothetical protein
VSEAVEATDADIAASSGTPNSSLLPTPKGALFESFVTEAGATTQTGVREEMNLCPTT